MTCTRHSQNNTPTLIGHNYTTQKAASNQFRTAVTQATPSTLVALINNSNIHIVKKLYTIRSAKQDDIYGASNIVLPCPVS
jgi:hypothetical protein